MGNEHDFLGQNQRYSPENHDEMGGKESAQVMKVPSNVKVAANTTQQQQ